ncbi:sushi, von Willebrand factor type A, EGF and pentraxin domain-containing protein 1-like isoform X2 [Sycon ciliatum]|uniref:sushi, von Willebrand factor type A, EGF and pentraxin domain-containing protein 1-like isoform X2 n=1 Tax=Sycon ciliatum TaxID=27933 RepID=UPI0031F6E932
MTSTSGIIALLLLHSLSAYWSYVNAQDDSCALQETRDYAAHFRCNTSDGLYLISSSPAWSQARIESAQTQCSTVKPYPYTLASIDDLQKPCYSEYLAYIRLTIGTQRTFWVSNGNSGTTCYPATSPCPATATVLCKNSLPLAVHGPECGGDLSLPNGIVTYPSGTRFPSDAVYMCNLGYHMMDGNNAHCTEGGQWCNTNKQCQAFTCPEPPINNGRTNGAGPRYQVTCSSGFELVGNASVTCTSNMATTNLPTCSQYVCVTSPVVTNGNFKVYSRLRDGMARMQCNDGYFPHDYLCEPPPAVENGEVRVYGNGEYGAAHLMCNGEYYVSGSNITTCLGSRSWSGTLGKCLRHRCESPPIVSNGNVSVDSFFWRGTARVACNSGYYLQGINTTTCLSNNSWSQTLGNCLRHRCESPPIVSNGNVSVDSFFWRGTARVTCNSGYYLQGINTTTCLSNNSWSQTLGNCLTITCPGEFISNITNAVVADDLILPYVVGNSTYVQCQSGYLGGGITSCTDNGTWTEVECYRIPCDIFQDIENGTMLLDNNTEPSRAVLECDEGYQLNGSEVLHCLPTGNWSAPIPSCELGEDSSATSGTSNSTTTIVIIITATIVVVCVLLAIALFLKRQAHIRRAASIEDEAYYTNHASKMSGPALNDTTERDTATSPPLYGNV